MKTKTVSLFSLLRKIIIIKKGNEDLFSSDL